MSTIIRLCIALALILVLALPAAAQVPTPGTDVLDAFARLAALESYSANVQTDIHQSLNISQGDNNVTIENALTQQGSVHVQTTNGLPEGYATLVHSFDARAAGSETNLDMTLQMVFLGDDTFVKFSDVSPGSGRSLPADWVDWQSAAPLFPGADLVDTTAMRDLLTQPMIYPVQSDTMLWVEERAAQTLDGEAMRVYFVRLDPVAVFDQGGTAVLTRLLRDQGVGADRDGVRDLLTHAMQIDLEVWVSMNDGLIHRMVDTTRINANVSQAAGLPLVLEQTSVTACELSGFNERVLVSVPPLMSPEVLVVSAGG
ncbi:MAG: hypothetical protein KC519_08085 [Anaerolineae bacterium]|nr:hypothetical protein [Anaerolineae bacterium]